MKKIRFRAKNTNNEWKYGYYAQGGNDSELKGIIMPQGENTLKIYEVEYKTVSQFLGVVNGIDIYTGDILKGKQTFENSTEYPLCYVDWDEIELQYILRAINGSVNPPWNWLKSFEKVGNIIDNPEMLQLNN